MFSIFQQFDAVVLRWANSWIFRNEWWDALIVFRLEWLPYWVMAGLLTFGLLAFLPKFRGSFRRNWEMIVAAISAGLVVRFGVAELIRAFYDRPRPFEILPDIRQLVSHEGGGSFPSGHAAFFFALAAVVGRYYPKTSIAFYVAALSLSGARVIAGIHWPSDILGGAVIGIAVGLLAHQLIQKYLKLK